MSIRMVIYSPEQPALRSITSPEARRFAIAALLASGSIIN
jgi:hypothetical protein